MFSRKLRHRLLHIGVIPSGLGCCPLVSDAGYGASRSPISRQRRSQTRLRSWRCGLLGGYPVQGSGVFLPLRSDCLQERADDVIEATQMCFDMRQGKPYQSTGA